MSERQQYYRELLQSLIEEHYDVELDPTKVAEAPLPNTRMDLLFDIPKQNLKNVADSPFPYLAELNVVHIKAQTDYLTRKDIIQYLAELYIIYCSTRAKDKSVALNIICAENIGKSIRDSLYSNIEETEYFWIEKITAAEVPAYIFFIDKIPEEHEHFLMFLPFKSLANIKKHCEQLHEIAPQINSNKKYAQVFFWLRKLQSAFYLKEFDMKIDMETVVQELCPKTLEHKKKEGKKEEKIEIAMNMLRENAEISFIIKVTGLPKKEVLQLKENLKKQNSQ